MATPNFLKNIIEETPLSDREGTWKLTINNDTPIMRILSVKQWIELFNLFDYQVVNIEETTSPLVYREQEDTKLVKTITLKNSDKDNYDTSLRSLPDESGFPPSQIISNEFDKFRDKYKPRQLTQDEVKHICNSMYKTIIKTTKLLPKAVSRLRIHQIVDVYRRFVSSPKFILSPFLIENYITHEIHQILRSQVENGDNVGLMATDAFGAPITQSVLNTRHKAGSGQNAQRNIDALNEILNISQYRKNPAINVYFTNKLTSFEEVSSYKHKFVAVYLSNLVDNYEFITPQEAKETAPWTPLYLFKSGNRTLPRCTTVMRIKLDKDKMFENRVDIVNVAIGIEQFTKNNVIAVPSGTLEFCIDIYPEDSQIQKSKEFEELLSGRQQEISKTYLITCISNYIHKDEIFVSGIKNITAYTPSFVDIPSLYKASSLTEDNNIRLYLDTGMVYRNGVSSYKLLSIVEKYIGKVVGYHTTHNVFEILNSKSDDFLLPKTTTVDEKYKFTTKDYNKLDKEVIRYLIVKPTLYKGQPDKVSKYIGEVYSKLQEEERKTTVENDEIRMFRHYYTIVDGDNFEDVITVPGVDTTRTYSNDFYKTFNLLGIEAMKNLLYIEGIMTLDSIGEYLTRTHLDLVVSSMTHYGFPVGTTYINMKKAGVFRPVTLSSSQRAYENLTLGGLYNVEENMSTSVSAAISVGLKVPVGTGMRNVELINKDATRDVMVPVYTVMSDNKGVSVAPVSKEQSEVMKKDLSKEERKVVITPGLGLDSSTVDDRVYIRDDKLPQQLTVMEKKIDDENDKRRFGDGELVSYEEGTLTEEQKEVVKKMEDIMETSQLIEKDPFGIELDFVF